MANPNKFTAKEVLNKVLLDSSGNAVTANSVTSQEALNSVLDTTNNRLNMSLAGGTISGDVTISGDLTVNGSATNSYDEIVNGDLHVKSDSGNSTSAFLVEKNDGTDVFIVDTTNSRVGINNSSPSVNLDFGVTSNNSQIINLRKNSTSVTGLGVNSNYGVRIAGPSDSSEPVSFGEISTSDGTTYTERMRIDSSGNVGIGTTSPTSLLHLENASSPTIRLKDTTNNVLLLAFAQDSDAGFGTYSGHPMKFYSNSTLALTLGTDQSATFSGDVLTTGKYQISNSTPELLFSVPGGGLDSRIHNDGSGNLIFGNGTNSATPTEAMRIDSGQNATFAGDVNIGTNGNNGLINLKRSSDGAFIYKCFRPFSFWWFNSINTIYYWWNYNNET
jgi:hypothetical protein